MERGAPSAEVKAAAGTAPALTRTGSKTESDTTTAVTTHEPDPGHDGAELSSITTVLEDLQTRVVEVADRWRAAEREDVAGDLYDVERSLRNAQRRIRRAVQGFDR